MIEYRILGPLEVVVDGDVVRLGGRKQRGVLAMLVLDAGRVVAVDRLIDGIWGTRPPATAAKSLQGYVSELRKLLGADAIITRSPSTGPSCDWSARWGRQNARRPLNLAGGWFGGLRSCWCRDWHLIPCG